MDDSMYILYQFDENYAPFAAVSMTSLFENNKDIQIVIYAFAENVCEATKKKLAVLVERYRGKLIFLDTASLINKMEYLGIPKYRGAYATNFKLFINTVLPSEITRILYLDCDTLVTDSLKDLFWRDLEGFSLAMALDSLGDKHAKLIGLSRDSYYVNGGVMLFDLPKWSEKRCAERIAEYAKNVRANFPSPDQDLLNIVLNGEIYILEPKYNFQPVHKVYSLRLYRFFWRWKRYYDDTTMIESERNIVIHHCFRYLGQFPWNKNSIHPDVDEFNRYWALSGWSDCLSQSAGNDNEVFKIERKLYRVLPAPVFLALFRIFYNCFIWSANRKSLKNQDCKNM